MDDILEELSNAMQELRQNEMLGGFLRLMRAKQAVEAKLGIRVSLDELGELLLAADDIVAPKANTGMEVGTRNPYINKQGREQDD